jgi:hypothetical protein
VDWASADLPADVSYIGGIYNELFHLTSCIPTLYYSGLDITLGQQLIHIGTMHLCSANTTLRFPSTCPRVPLLPFSTVDPRMEKISSDLYHPPVDGLHLMVVQVIEEPLSSTTSRHRHTRVTYHRGCFDDGVKSVFWFEFGMVAVLCISLPLVIWRKYVAQTGR